MDNNALLDFGLDIVNAVAEDVVLLSKDNPLGKEIGSVGAGGDQTKIADDHAEKIVKSKISHFLSDNKSPGNLRFHEANPN